MPETFPSINPWYSLFESPVFATRVIEYGNKIEQRIQTNSNEQWRFQLQWDILSEADKQTLQQFYLNRKGKFEAFTWNHPEPSQVKGTDGLNYTCKKTHIATNDNKPITGGSYATYWTKAGNRGITWASGSKYKYDFLCRFNDDAVNYEYFNFKLWKWNKVELIEVIN